MKSAYRLALSFVLLAAAQLACRTLLGDPGGEQPPTASPTQVSQIATIESIDPASLDPGTLEALQDARIPINDPEDLARRLQGITEFSEPPTTFVERRVGESQSFFVSNSDTAQTFEVDATLQYVTAHSYFWIEDGVAFDSGDLRDLAETFEDEIYPTNRNFFGSEWAPGIDGDPHLYILFAGGIGDFVAGYYSSADQIDPAVRPDSNGHEMFVLSADNLELDETFTYSVLAHEFQHMIHWNWDANETSWLNEGFSELAQLLNGYPSGGTDLIFADNPDHQLNTWPNDPNTSAYYGAGFLFTAYFLDRFGDEATQALVAHPANGMTSVDLVLEELAITDALTGAPVTAEDLVLDWALTNYLGDPGVGDGRFDYGNYPGAPLVRQTETESGCQPGAQSRDVRQYGADYIRVACGGQVTLLFDGSDATTLLPAEAYSGEHYFYSNKGDTSDMTLTRAFDFTSHSGPLTLSFWTWFDIELDWDYVYIMSSVDDGATWEIITTPSGTDTNPSGNSYGWGWTGTSAGETPAWMQEDVDISHLAGQEVLLRFEYITDAAVNGEGMVIDDVSIPETDYFSDFEQDEGGWEAEGWVRATNVLPQAFRLALIADGGDTTVEYITLDEGHRASIPLDFDAADEYVLVVMGTTRFTRQPAAYSFDFAP
jgi:hypothetical protein